jgi:hypothetical protein
MDPTMHGLINYVDTKAKCRHLKQLTCKGTLLQVCICLRAPPPSYSHREGGMGDR